MPDELDMAALKEWLAPRVEGVDADMTATRISGGQSNPSWLVRSGGHTWVLRTKPAPVAELPPSAHAIEREYTVQSALADSGVPVPRMLALCEDESVIGVMFYLMEHVPGRVFREGWAPGLTTEKRSRLFDELSEVIARLHSVDVASVGLTGYGRSGDYFSRLFSRWTRMYETSKTCEIPAMDRLIEWLPRHVPEHARNEATIVHGDFRLENLIIAEDAPEIRAVLDWELSTIGHPLVDVAYTALPWHLGSGVVRGFADLNIAELGIPSEEHFVTRYCEVAGRDDTEQVFGDWPFYLGCNFFRLAAILQGITRRVEDGMASGPDAARTGAMAGPVADAGWAVVTSATKT